MKKSPQQKRYYKVKKEDTVAASIYPFMRLDMPYTRESKLVSFKEFISEDTTLKSREDQYDSAKRNYDKKINKFLVRSYSQAKKMGLSDRGTKKVLTKFSKDRDLEAGITNKTKDSGINNIRKASDTLRRKAVASGLAAKDRLKKTIKVPNYGMKTEEFKFRKQHKNPKGGLSSAGRKAYNSATGSNLKPPAPHPKTEKDAGRRKSFCARMSGMKRKLTSSKTANDPNSRINKSLRAWKC